MNKKTFAWIQLIACTMLVLFLLIILMAGLLNFNIGFSLPGSADSKFTSGSGEIETKENELKKLNIDWLDGTVQIEGIDDAGTISIEETSGQALSDAEQVHYYYHSGVLDIRYKNKKYFSLLKNKGYNKNLVVKIPKKYYDSNALTISVDAVSAHTTIKNLDIKKLKTDSVSGEIRFEGSVSEINCDTISGNLLLNSATTPALIKTDSVSAEVNINLPFSSEFTAEYDGVSGHLNVNGFGDSMSSEGNKFVRKTESGNSEPDNSYSFDSVSGNVNLNAVN